MTFTINLPLKHEWQENLYISTLGESQLGCPCLYIYKKPIFHKFSHFSERWNEIIAAGQSRPKSAPAFRPRYCFLDKKVLRFYAYFEEFAGLDDRSPDKRIRNVQILYHLEDDSIYILEPRVQVRTD